MNDHYQKSLNIQFLNDQEARKRNNHKVFMDNTKNRVLNKNRKSVTSTNTINDNSVCCFEILYGFLMFMYIIQYCTRKSSTTTFNNLNMFAKNEMKSVNNKNN